jgi:hypothetical protein
MLRSFCETVAQPNPGLSRPHSLPLMQLIASCCVESRLGVLLDVRDAGQDLGACSPGPARPRPVGAPGPYHSQRQSC